jgi:hypothetical protein
LTDLASFWCRQFDPLAAKGGRSSEKRQAPMQPSTSHLLRPLEATAISHTIRR